RPAGVPAAEPTARRPAPVPCVRPYLPSNCAYRSSTAFAALHPLGGDDHLVVRAEDLRRVAAVGRPLAAAHLPPGRGRAGGAEAGVLFGGRHRISAPPVRRRRVREGPAAGVRLEQLDLGADAVERGREVVLAAATVAGAEAGEVVVACAGGEAAGLDVSLSERDVAAHVLGVALVDVH